MLCKGYNTEDINEIFWWRSKFGLVLLVYETQVGYFVLFKLRPGREIEARPRRNEAGSGQAGLAI